MNIGRKPNLSILGILISLASVSAVLFTPALPQIQRYFAISATDVQSTVTLFLLGYAIGQLLYGPIANRLGRKPTIYLGIGLGVAGSLLSVLSYTQHSFSLLLFSRTIEALGTGAGYALAMTIINDAFNGEHARKAMASATAAFAVMPGLSVAIGGFLTEHFGWYSCFIFLSCYGVAALALCTTLPETLVNRDPHALKLSRIVQNYLKVGKNKSLLLFGCTWGFVTAIIYTFATLGPLIAHDTLNISPNKYGLLCLFIYAGMFAGNMAARLFAKRINAFSLMKIGYAILAVGVACLYFDLTYTPNSVFAFFAINTLIMAGTPLLFSNCAVLAAEELTDKANASALIAFINMAIAIICIFGIGAAHYPISTVLFGFDVIAMCFILIGLVLGKQHKLKLAHLSTS